MKGNGESCSLLLRYKYTGLCYNDFHGGLAQLGERTLHRGDVAGSSPVASTMVITVR